MIKINIIYYIMIFTIFEWILKKVDIILSTKVFNYLFNFSLNNIVFYVFFYCKNLTIFNNFDVWVEQHNMSSF